MKKVLAFFFAIFFCASFANADWWRHSGWGRYGGYRHSSTFAEGWQRGRAVLWAGRGDFLRSLGKYRIYNQEAYSMAIDNHRKAVHTWWELKDEYRERFRRDHPDFVTRENKRLDMAEDLYELNKRKERLMKKGVIPKPEPTQIIINGKSYSSYEEFKGSPDWIRMRNEAAERHKRKPIAPEPPVRPKKFEQIW